MMETEVLQKIEQLAITKHSIFTQSKLRYLMRSIIASMFIGFGVFIAFKTASFFYASETLSALTYPAAGLMFCMAIILIYYGGGDLFTGNTFYYTYSSLRHKLTWGTSLKLAATSYIGNLIGAILFAILVYLTGAFFSEGVHGFLLEVANKKIDGTFTEIFVKAILCNWLVCMAFFLPYKMKTDGAKMFIMILLVTCFFVAGFEHSIANMSIFAISFAAEGLDAFTANQLLHNMIPATLGNIVGGAVCMAMFYYYVNKPYFNESGE